MAMLLDKVTALFSRPDQSGAAADAVRIDVLREAMKGGSDAEIANALALNARTIGGHLRNIRHKTKSTRFELMRGVDEP